MSNPGEKAYFALETTLLLITLPSQIELIDPIFLCDREQNAVSATPAAGAWGSILFNHGHRDPSKPCPPRGEPGRFALRLGR
jgi:hypothetical protein